MDRLIARPLIVLTIALTACEGNTPATPEASIPSADSSAVIAEGQGNNAVNRVSIYVGQQADLVPNNSRRARLATWRSSNDGIAQVTPTGVVTGVNVGEATVSSSDGTSSLVWVLPAPTVTAFTIAPKQGADLPQGAVRQFSTTAVWSDGATRAAGVTYQASTGTISPGGLFTAGTQTGNTRVIATCDCGKADTAIVVVSAAAQLTALRISPKTVTLPAGAIMQFSASANWSTGATDLPPLSYSAQSPGAISATGEYKAPSTAGTYFVIVAHVGGNLRDTARVTVSVSGGDPVTPPPVTAPPTTPPPDTTTAPPLVPTSFTPNLPTNLGLRLIVDTRFNNWREANWNAPDSLIYYNAGRLATDNTAPYGSNVFETYYAGNDAGNGTGGAKFFSPGVKSWRRVYFSMMMWVPRNYVVHSYTEKFFYPPVYTNGTNNHGAAVNWYANTDSTFGFAASPGFNRTIEYQEPRDGGAFVKKGKWSLIEMYMEMNTPGQHNGILKTWVDGQPGWVRTDMEFGWDAVSQGYLGMIYFDGTRGGGASLVLTPPEGQVRRYNRLAFYAQ